MQEVGGDHVGDERRGLFLEHERHNVVSYVAFPLELKENIVIMKPSCPDSLMSDLMLLCHIVPHHVSCCVLLVIYLLCVSFSEGQLGGDVEHDLLLSVDGVDGLRTCLTVRHIQTPPKPAHREEGQSEFTF